MSCLNSLLGLVDTLLYGRDIAQQQLHDQPVIILGVCLLVKLYVCTVRV